MSPRATAYLGLEFEQRFGGSCRTKHLIRQPDSLGSLLAYGWAIARRRLVRESKRVYPMSRRSELPRELIRLDPWEARYLFAVAKLARVGIVEIGRYQGGGVMGDLERFYPLLSRGGNVLLHDCWDETVQKAVVDFLAKTPDVQIVRSPYVPAAHWLTEYGSIGHLRKT